MVRYERSSFTSYDALGHEILEHLLFGVR